MSHAARNIFALAAVLVLAGCTPRGVIPKSRMADIYVEMFIADQWLRDNNYYRAQADTSLFFDPIFKKYGYDFEDYDRSVEYYSARPDQYARIAEAAQSRLKKESARLDTLEARNRVARETNLRNRVDYSRKEFPRDSAGWQRDSIIWPK